MKTNIKFLIFSLMLTLYLGLKAMPAIAQENNSHVLTMNEALQLTLSRQELLKAKANYTNASKENITAARRDGAPDFILSAQQGYGTINGLNGLPSGINGLISTISGPVSASQNWNAAFAALYSSEINWNIFSFGLQKAHVADAKGIYDRDEADLEQEKFQQQVRVASAYLNLLDAQRLHYSEEVNLSRVSALRDVILTRTVNGLNAGVDSSIANAQLSQAKNALTEAISFEQKQAAALAIQLGMTKQDFLLDSLYINQLPAHLPQRPVYDISNHPQLRFLAERVKSSELDAIYLSKTSLPKVSFFGAVQERGSGFGTSYNPADPGSYNQGYFNGIAPLRGNYLIGVGVSWNLSNMGRVSSRLKSQRYYADGLTNEYHYQETNLTNQLEEGNKQLANALQKYREVPILLKAASDAYEQKKTLYSNGLATIVDVTQTLYDLNRAETNKDIAGNAVWQALLYMAGSSGNLELFTNQY